MKPRIRALIESALAQPVIITRRMHPACSICRQYGHYSTTCPIAPPVPKKPAVYATDPGRVLTPALKAEARREARGFRVFEIYGSKSA